MCDRPRLLGVTLALVLWALADAAVATDPQRRRASAGPAPVRPVLWSEARAIVERFEEVLPPSLREIPRAERSTRWDAWLADRRRALSVRVAQGDVDSVVNLLLFGTSFTKEPRVTAARLRSLDERWRAGDPGVADILTRHYQQRAADLLRAASSPGADERMQEVRRVLSANGHALATARDRERATAFLFANLTRIKEEAARLAAELESLRASGDATARFAERSRIFRDRGLAGDSSVLTQFAVDRALCGLRERGVLPAGSVARAAIVGPGLDFADKDEGFDFYPPQSLQPFTLIDSLLHCELASKPALRVTTLDVSPRVNAHLQRAVARGAYRLILPWKLEARANAAATAYWERAGNRIGTPFAVASALPEGVRARGIGVSPEIVRAVRPLDASIVTDRVAVGDGEGFDLVLASNVLLYYDRFEQTLAFASIAAMLEPGGVLLSNDALLEVGEVPMRSGGYLAVPFSNRDGHGERMIWYVRTPHP